MPRLRNPHQLLHLCTRALPLTQRTGSSWAPWCCHLWPVPDGREVFSSKCTLSATENRWERGAQKCPGTHKYFMQLNQMEKARLLLFQMEVAETSSHLRLIGTLPSDQSLETKEGSSQDSGAQKGSFQAGGGAQCECHRPKHLPGCKWVSLYAFPEGS